MSNTTDINNFISWAGLNQTQVTRIKDLQHRKNISFFQAALLNKSIGRDEYIRFFSEKLKIPVVDPSCFEGSDGVQELVPAHLCRNYQCVPFYRADRFLFLAMAEPDNILAVDDIRFLTGLEPVVHAADPESIHCCLEQDPACVSGHWQHLDEALADIDEQGMDLVEDEQQTPDDMTLVQEASQGPVVKMVNLIILDAIRKKASDIHIEAYEKTFRVRFRIDGVLQETMRPPVKMRAAIVSRLKIMSHLNIAEKRLPQDGRIKVLIPQGREVEFRVSILPTLFGEKVVMRFLDTSALKIDMTGLGVDAQILEAIQKVIAKPFGMLLVTGPTGSGKTTTLYSALMELNKDGVNISTVEDPVEFTMPGINQVHVNEKIGLTFSRVLRSFLRQDPDIILVGEIRDSETAQIAVKASLTGHLVLATLHTNDAPGTISRLMNMGVEGFLLSSGISGILAQRLARKLCPECKRRTEPPSALMKELRASVRDGGQDSAVWEPVGCPSCNHSGYTGRIGVYEMLMITPEIQELIVKGASTQEIRNVAVQQGMQTLRQNALNKLKAGTLSSQEVFRVTAD